MKEDGVALNLARLRLFQELSVLGTISAVAQNLGLTRPAISQQLALLERETGSVLFERSARGLKMTTKGRQLLDQIQPMLELVNSIEEELAADEKEPSGELRLAAFGSVAASIVPLAVGYLLKRYPAIEVVFLELEPSEGLKATAAKQVDVAIVDDLVEPGPFSGVLQFHPLYVDRLCAVLSSDHRLASRGAVTLELRDLATDRWAVNQIASSYRTHLLNACLAAGFEIRVGCSAHNIAASLEMVRTGHFVTVLPELALQVVRSDPDFLMVPVHPPLLRTIFTAVQKGTVRRPVIAATLEALERGANTIRGG